MARARAGRARARWPGAGFLDDAEYRGAGGGGPHDGPAELQLGAQHQAAGDGVSGVVTATATHDTQRAVPVKSSSAADDCHPAHAASAPTQTDRYRSAVLSRRHLDAAVEVQEAARAVHALVPADAQCPGAQRHATRLLPQVHCGPGAANN